MNNPQEYQKLWTSSKQLSKSYWTHYNQLIGDLGFVIELEDDSDSLSVSSNNLKKSSSYTSSWNDSVDDNVNQEYLEFIRITRKHQLQRENLKKERGRPQPQVDEYYKDISQVNTLIEDNVAEIPIRKKTSKAKLEEIRLIEKYGSRENYDRIRSIEICIDDVFRQKCQEHGPSFWPVIPLNPKPYLNKS